MRNSEAEKPHERESDPKVTSALSQSGLAHLEAPTLPEASV